MGLFDNQAASSGVSTSFNETIGNAIQQNLSLTGIFGSLLKGFKELIGGDPFNKNEERLRERFLENIPGMMQWALDNVIGNGLFQKDRIKQVMQARPNDWWKSDLLGASSLVRSDDATLIPLARQFFTTLFGVRIIDDKYLNALDVSPAEYYKLDYTSDIPLNSVERAVYLKQNFYPQSTYNNTQWDLSHFQDYPLVAPVPNAEKAGQTFTGNFMGFDIKNGILQSAPALADNGKEIVDQTSGSKVLDLLNDAKANPAKTLMIVGGIILLIIIIIVISKKRR